MNWEEERRKLNEAEEAERRKRNAAIAARLRRYRGLYKRHHMKGHHIAITEPNAPIDYNLPLATRRRIRLRNDVCVLTADQIIEELKR
jgi:hypothetical protein